MGKFGGWLKQLSAIGKTGVILASFLGVGIVSAAANPAAPQTPQLQQTPPAAVKAAVSEAPKVPVVTTHEETTTEAVPYDTKTVQSGALDQGTKQITTRGVAGVKTKKWSVTTTDGVETGRTLVSETVTTQPVTEIETVGTKVALNCPNGTYTNSAGSTVCSPAYSEATPSGATAKCRDGTYSYSQSRSGTCSHHGGVATWL